MPIFSITNPKTGKQVQINAPRQPTEAEVLYITSHRDNALPQTLTEPIRLNLDSRAQEAAAAPLATPPGMLLPAPRRAAPPPPAGPMQLFSGVTSAPAAAAVGSLADDPGDALKAIHEALKTAWLAPVTPTEEQPTMGGELEKRGVPMSPLTKTAVDIFSDPTNLIGGGPEDLGKVGIAAAPLALDTVKAGAKGLGRLYTRLVEDVLPKFKAKAAHPSRIMSDVKNFGSPMEAEWTGLTDWLTKKGNTPVAREEFEKFIKDNPLKIEETKLGFAKGEDARSLPQTVVSTGYGPDSWSIEHPWAQSGTNTTAHVNKFTPDDHPVTIPKGWSPEKPYRAAFQNKSEWFAKPDEAIDWAKKQQMDTLASDGIAREVNKPRWGRSDLNLPGGENYREIVMRLPEHNEIKAESLSRKEFDEMGTLGQKMRASGNLPPGEMARWSDLNARNKAYDEAVQAAKTTSKVFRHDSHWPGQVNPLAHLRLNDRVTADGKKALHIEELQSDWGQQHGIQLKALHDAVDSNFEDVVARMKKAGVLTQECG